jgi:hypothetical protein
MVKLDIKDTRVASCLAKVRPFDYLGGFAKCYEGFNLETKKAYAIKVIDKVSLQKNRAKQKVNFY